MARPHERQSELAQNTGAIWIGVVRGPEPPPRSGARAVRERKRTSVDAVEPRVDLTLGVILRDTIALLKPAGEFRPFALDHVEVVVGELAPLLLSLAFELFPVAFNTVPIHCLLLPNRSRDSLNPGFERKFRSMPRSVNAYDCGRKDRGRSRQS